MSNFTFNCPSCGTRIITSSEMSGQLVDCPQCKQTVEAPLEQVVRRQEYDRKIFNPALAATTQSQQRSSGWIWFIVIPIGSIIGFLSWISPGSSEKAAQQRMDEVYSQVSSDAEQQYYIAKRNGSKMDAYVHAGFVAAAYLQANDEANYKKWKEIERQDGIRAGMDPKMLR
jgi:DNA-directed RNA polymerase subunit M/transcription elongation factor TFIIS